MKITAVMATCGRHYYCERALGMFLTQTHPDKHLVILQNSETEQALAAPCPNVTLVNLHGFSSLGEIYNCALEFVPPDTELFCLFDDDDVYLPQHMEVGEKGYLRGGKAAYKPKFSFMRNGVQISRVNNVLEPSWFVRYDVICQQRFREETNRHHFNWVEWCIRNHQLFVDPDGVPTLGYTWGNPESPVYKTSGGGQRPDNFERYRRFSQDHGDQVITAHSVEMLAPLFQEFRQWKPAP
jgi:hypothetical protein